MGNNHRRSRKDDISSEAEATMLMLVCHHLLRLLSDTQNLFLFELDSNSEYQSVIDGNFRWVYILAKTLDLPTDIADFILKPDYFMVGRAGRITETLDRLILEIQAKYPFLPHEEFTKAVFEEEQEPLHQIFLSWFYAENDTTKRQSIKELAAYIESNPASDVCNHSKDFSSVCWFGKRYTFSTGYQARCVALLWEEWEKGGLSLNETSIAETLGAEFSFRLSHVFRIKNKASEGYTPHPAWGTMIHRIGKSIFALRPPLP